MKKIFFSLLAIAAIASCAKTEAVYTEAESEIKLAPVTALQTKAKVLAAIDGTEYPTNENFDVYGYWKNGDASNYTNGESYFGGAVEFKNKGNYWGGIETYYWPKNGTLRFAAYSPADLDIKHNQEGDTFSKNGYIQPSKTSETWDFLVAPTSAPYTAMTAAENVSVVFEHALSWITLKVKAKDDAAAEVFTIKNITINKVKTTADFKASMLGKDMVDYESWSNWGDDAEYVVFEGAQSVTGEATVIENTPAGTLVIPQATTKLTVTFDQKGVNNTMDMENMVETLDLVLDQDNEPWRPGKHYIYTLVFGLNEILINPSVSDWEDVEVGTLEPGATNVSTAAQLEAALAKPETTKIVFQANIAGQFNVPEAAKTLTIDGNGYELNGSFTIVGNSSYTGGTTIFENINFVAADAADVAIDAFIYGGTVNKDNSYRYPDNVTIKNCTFTAEGSAVESVVSAKFWSLKDNLVVENCSAEYLHSLVQLTSCGETAVAIEKVTIENCKNGISLGNAGKTTIRNSNISTKEYGIRAEGCVANTSIVKTTIEAEKPIIVRKLNAATQTYNVVLEDVTLEPGQSYAVVFTNDKDDVDFVAPVGKYTITGAAGYLVYPQNAATSKETFAAALANPEVDVIDMLADLTYANTESISIEKDVTINGNDCKIAAGGGNSKSASISVYGDYDVTVSDANLTGGSIMAYYGANVVLNDVNHTYTFTGSGRNIIYAASDNDKQVVVVINGGTYDMTPAGSGNTYVCAHGNAVVYINGGTFTGKGAYASNAPINAPALGAYTPKVIISGGTFDFDPSSNYIASGNKVIAPQATIATGYKVVKDGSNWTVVAE